MIVDIEVGEEMIEALGEAKLIVSCDGRRVVAQSPADRDVSADDEVQCAANVIAAMTRALAILGGADEARRLARKAADEGLRGWRDPRGQAGGVSCG